ncbi:MAG: sulfatase [Bryobacteraceae bacterium]|nr:sulfatase [Bryobacteraceae bacterium]MDW8379555.1 sulfatase [Bryobacterales bacterium]
MPYSRRSLLQTPAALAPALLQGQPRRPNFVFLISDDHSYPDLGALGRPVRTPNLDRIAAEGVVFENCFVSSPQCSPNRSSIFTGCTPHTTSTSRLHTPMPDWERTFVDDLRQAGYFAGAFRKVHQGNAFDKRTWNFYATAQEPFQKFFDALPPGRPFFLHIGFTDPHRVYKRGRYPVKHDPAQVVVPAFLPDDEEIRDDLADYYNAISRMDMEVGQVLDLLKQRNLMENTLVLFTGDNGMPFPGAKGTCYDPGIRVPLLAWWPGRTKPGTKQSELISHVDLPCTWLEAAGLPIPKRMQGRSFLPLLTGLGDYRPREAVFSERNWHDHFDPQRCVRTRRHKLIFNALPHLPYRPIGDLRDSPTWAAYLRLAHQGKLSAAHLRLHQPARPMIELYDLEKDPNEFHNVATDPQYATVREDLQRKLSDWMHETYDFLPPCYATPGASSGRGWPLSL